MRKAGKFDSVTNPGTAKCSGCGKRRQVANMARTGADPLCGECYDFAGDENAVSDGVMTSEEFHAKYDQCAWSCDHAKADPVAEADRCRGKWSLPNCQNAAVSATWRICRSCTEVRKQAKAWAKANPAALAQ